MAVYTWRDGTLRLFDSTAATPFGLTVRFVRSSVRGPLGRPRPEEQLVLDRALMDATYTHYIRGSDAAILEPVEITLAAVLDSSANKTRLLAALQCGTVDGDVWASTKGDTSLTNGAGSSVAAPAFADSEKKTINVEELYDDGANDQGYRWNEVYFPPDQIQIEPEEDGVMLRATGLCYGTIEAITALTAINES